MYSSIRCQSHLYALQFVWLDCLQRSQLITLALASNCSAKRRCYNTMWHNCSVYLLYYNIMGTVNELSWMNRKPANPTKYLATNRLIAKIHFRFWVVRSLQCMFPFNLNITGQHTNNKHFSQLVFKFQQQRCHKFSLNLHPSWCSQAMSYNT